MNKVLLISFVVITTAVSTFAQSTEVDRAYAKARQAYHANFYSTIAQRQRQVQNYQAATSKEAAATAAVYEVAPKVVNAISPVRTIAEAAPKTVVNTISPVKTIAEAAPKATKEKNSVRSTDRSPSNVMPYPGNQGTTDVRLLYPNNPAMWKWLRQRDSKPGNYKSAYR